ncbi:MAG: hypothetical protein A3J14_02025 [Candidatus Levybacteria bacterium RIFCSPLOWO2_02_FULL_37_18]|nr:MAG: hypothetical protein A3J14_02025 [Candidatus Levybacteria bacterium RIFCSPLOWO2_02_FULL_37_18]
MSIIFKVLIFWYSLTSFFKRKILVKNIGKDDLVLDVGSGDKPFWRADVIVDKYLQDDQQRHSGAVVNDKRKIFIEGDVERLPFKDKVFDFVFCSHLLEHVENPDMAIAELVRVAKRGYIEVPYAIVDLLMPFPPHLWFCFYKKDTLIFHQKEKEKNILIHDTERFGKIFYNSSLVQYLFAKDYKSIFITLYWRNNLKYSVTRVKNPYRYIYKEELHEKTLFIKISFVLYKIFYFFITGLLYKKKKIDIDKLLLIKE